MIFQNPRNHFSHRFPARCDQILEQGSSQELQIQEESLYTSGKSLSDKKESFSQSEIHSSEIDPKRCKNKSKTSRKNSQQYNDSYLKMIMRLKKEAKYSSLETLSMIMLKNRNLFTISKDIAKRNGIRSHKNYSIIGMRLGLLFHEQTFHDKMTPEEAKQQTFQFFQSELESCLQKKYNDSNSQTFIQMVKEKNILDISVFKRVFQSDMSFKSVFNILQDLYQRNKDNSFSKKNVKFAETVAKIIIEAAKTGRKYNSTSKQISKQAKSIKSKVCLSLKIEQSNKSMVDESVCKNVSSIKSLSTFDLLDLASPGTIEKYTVVRYSPVLKLQQNIEETNQNSKESMLQSSNEDQQIFYYL